MTRKDLSGIGQASSNHLHLWLPFFPTCRLLLFLHACLFSVAIMKTRLSLSAIASKFTIVGLSCSSGSIPSSMRIDWLSHVCIVFFITYMSLLVRELVR